MTSISGPDSGRFVAVSGSGSPPPHARTVLREGFHAGSPPGYLIEVDGVFYRIEPEGDIGKAFVAGNQEMLSQLGDGCKQIVMGVIKAQGRENSEKKENVLTHTITVPLSEAEAITLEPPPGESLNKLLKVSKKIIQGRRCVAEACASIKARGSVRLQEIKKKKKTNISNDSGSPSVDCFAGQSQQLLPHTIGERSTIAPSKPKQGKRRKNSAARIEEQAVALPADVLSILHKLRPEDQEHLSECIRENSKIDKNSSEEFVAKRILESARVRNRVCRSEALTEEERHAVSSMLRAGLPENVHALMQRVSACSKNVFGEAESWKQDEVDAYVEVLGKLSDDERIAEGEVFLLVLGTFNDYYYHEVAGAKECIDKAIKAMVEILPPEVVKRAEDRCRYNVDEPWRISTIMGWDESRRNDGYSALQQLPEASQNDVTTCLDGNAQIGTKSAAEIAKLILNTARVSREILPQVKANQPGKVDQVERLMIENFSRRQRDQYDTVVRVVAASMSPEVDFDNDHVEPYVALIADLEKGKERTDEGKNLLHMLVALWERNPQRSLEGPIMQVLELLMDGDLREERLNDLFADSPYDAYDASVRERITALWRRKKRRTGLMLT